MQIKFARASHLFPLFAVTARLGRIKRTNFTFYGRRRQAKIFFSFVNCNVIVLRNLILGESVTFRLCSTVADGFPWRHEKASATV